MSDLTRVDEKGKNENRETIISFIFGLAGIVIIFFALSSCDAAIVSNYIDIPSFIFLLALQIVVLAMAGQLGNFVNAIKLIFKSNNYSAEELAEKVPAYEYALSFSIKVTIVAGIIIALFGFIDVLQNVWAANMDILGVNLAVGSIVILYSMIFAIIILPIKSRLHKLIS
jgi:hypothetical protein